MAFVRPRFLPNQGWGEPPVRAGGGREPSPGGSTSRGLREQPEDRGGAAPREVGVLPPPSGGLLFDRGQSATDVTRRHGRFGGHEGGMPGGTGARKRDRVRAGGGRKPPKRRRRVARTARGALKVLKK